jgi:uncharacterized membrane protein YphA (DoxX/SURF4 family)
LLGSAYGSSWTLLHDFDQTWIRSAWGFRVARCHSGHCRFVIWGESTEEDVMNISLWTAQVVLAVCFSGSGAAKSTMSRDRMLATGQTGIAMFPLPVVRFTAVMELLAAVGLVVPRLTGIATFLTPLAAAGLCVVMFGAAWAHARLHEPRSVTVNAALFCMAAFVAVGRIVG